MKIIVLVKQVPDTWGDRKLDPTSGLLDRASSDVIIDEVNERALEVALRYKDADKATEVIVLSMGPASATDVLRKGLAMGADSGIHVIDDDLAGSDVGQTAAAIAAAIRSSGYDLVVAGNESTDGRGGVVPAMVAEHLGVPQLSYLNSVEITEQAVRGERGTENGTLEVQASLPAVVSVTERSAEARFPNFKGIMSAKKKPIQVVGVADLDIDWSGASRSVVLSTVERPARTAGTKIVDDGTAGTQLAEFLTAARLI